MNNSESTAYVSSNPWIWRNTLFQLAALARNKLPVVRCRTRPKWVVLTLQHWNFPLWYVCGAGGYALLLALSICRALILVLVHWGVCSSVLDTNPRGVAGGVREGVGCGRGGGRKIFSIFGAFLNSPFHSEQFEHKQVG